jgi:hypothetical protein
MHNNTPTAQAAATPDTTTTPDSARCTAAALYLMSHYAQRPCPLVAHAIADQLGILSRQYVEGTSRLMQSLAATLLPRWQAIASGNAATIHH